MDNRADENEDGNIKGVYDKGDNNDDDVDAIIEDGNKVGI